MFKRPQDLPQDKAQPESQFDDQELLPGRDYSPQVLMPVYAFDAPSKLLQSKSRPADSEAQSRVAAIVKRIASSSNLGNLRFVNYPLQAAGGRLASLRQSHPHFSQVIDLVQNQLVLAMATDMRLSIPPILLWGPPGVGKTHFAQELASVLGTGMHRLAFDSELTGSALLGSDKKWSNATCGAVFEALVFGEHANPVMLLDEIDKAAKGRYGADPLASLHSLLEPVSASHVVDISLDFEMDASAVIWICTANDPRRVAPTLRSRMQEFMIEMPDAEQCLQIAESVGRSVWASMAVEGLEPPSGRIRVQLAHLTPREQYQALKAAYAKAITSGRLRLVPSDLDAVCGDACGQLARGPLLH